ncbi:hypothetical protein NS228_13960 [Methylobacterium indicum]|uniref:DUF1134 domain-containing protein n=2 Tax=Methylobacterium indicum TaxID=1775910 RepID=A0ABR5H321_9HYPH|nr:hypothetical protein QR78_23540 [Methylobacterium indicum]KMO17825.1 hypothetical protein QR79_21240 [Methylobacterium indicum]KTS36877.1 hypothetical protein NS229_09210 [Methylobacterium indicum]KTS39792.1 hypothetical protein NS228_13960 [Methylobacterium indicum]KTS49521.1 hypothetical protein NS230_17730 [Methylobacterium indicum]
MLSASSASSARQSPGMSRRRALAALLLAATVLPAALPGAAAAQGRRPGDPGTFQPQEIIDSGHQFFGSVSRGLALTVQEATRRWGEPNGYILGQEASGAIIGGVRYGEGTLFTRNAGQRKVYWQGPSLGFDVGGDGARSMMLVYNLPRVNALYRRFVGMDGSAYVVGGFGMSAVTADNIVVVPIRAGVGARFGINIGYLKFTDAPTWNPF